MRLLHRLRSTLFRREAKREIEGQLLLFNEIFRGKTTWREKVISLQKNFTLQGIIES